jgi:hypothetical protein
VVVDLTAPASTTDLVATSTVHELASLTEVSGQAPSTMPVAQVLLLAA